MSCCVLRSVGGVCRHWRTAVLTTDILWRTVHMDRHIHHLAAAVMEAAVAPGTEVEGSSSTTTSATVELLTPTPASAVPDPVCVMEAVLLWLSRKWQTAAAPAPIVSLTLPSTYPPSLSSPPPPSSPSSPGAAPPSTHTHVSISGDQARRLRQLCPLLTELVVPDRAALDDEALRQLIFTTTTTTMTSSTHGGIYRNAATSLATPLERLVLANAGACTALSDAALLSAVALPTLTTQSLGGSFELLAQWHLRELVINHCPSPSFTSRSVVQLVAQCERLSVLKVQWCAPRSRLSTADVAEMAHSGRARLRVLMVEMEEEVKSAAVEQLWGSAVCRDLHALHLRGWHDMCGQDVTVLLRGLRALRELCIVGSGSRTRWTGARIESATLQRLQVSHVQSVRRMELGWCPQLREMCWDGVGHMADITVDALPVAHFCMHASHSTGGAVEDGDKEGLGGTGGPVDAHAMFHDWRDLRAMQRRVGRQQRRQRRRQVQAQDSAHTAGTPVLSTSGPAHTSRRSYPVGGEDADLMLYDEGVWDMWETGQRMSSVEMMRVRSCTFGSDADLHSMLAWADSGSRLRQLEVFDCGGVRSLWLVQPCATTTTATTTTSADPGQSSDTIVSAATATTTATIASSNDGLRFPSLRSVSLFMCPDLVRVAMVCAGLRDVNIDACMDLRRLVVCSPLLQTCTLFPLPQPQFPALEHLRVECGPHMCSLNLQRCVNLRRLSLRCAGLQALNAGGCKVLEEVSLQCPLVKKLALSGPRMVRPIDWAAMALHCPSVTMLSLSNVSVLDDASMEQLCASPWGQQLSALIVAGCQGLVSPTLRCAALRGLQLVDCRRLERPVLHCPLLAKLFVRNAPAMGDTLLESLRSCLRRPLHSLELVECGSVTRVEQMPVCDKVRVVRCRSVVAVSIVQQHQHQHQHQGQRISFDQCERLERVQVIGHSGGELHIARCPALRQVHCSNFRIFQQQQQHEQPTGDLPGTAAQHQIHWPR